MSDISKAEEYLLKRLEMLSDEKIILVTKVNKLNIEIEQIDAMIKQIAQDVDTAFEIFSPRQKKNDFAKQEIDKLLSHKEELKETVASLTESANELEEDIQAIREALGQPVEINDIDIEDEYIESVYYEDTTYGMKILEQQENERSRIARDLHDSVVQVLTNLVHKCEICSKIMDVDGIRAKLELEIMSRNLREAISEMRNIIYDLRPMSFDDLGLNVTLESFINDVKSRTNMEIRFNVEGTPNVLPSIMQLTIFRVVQEATNNSIKHSKGKKLDIVFKYDSDNIYLNIKDDGIGIEKESEENKQSLHTGFGLDMMKERVALLNGKIEVLTAEDGGTSIEVIIPILQEAT
ncbi:MAG: histidine kinase [Lachnospiraceae bacterium]|nr:histidine kinase [Lachnospiraceae bacterium]